jgi:hypothetical protein
MNKEKKQKEGEVQRLYRPCEEMRSKVKNATSGFFSPSGRGFPMAAGMNQSIGCVGASRVPGNRPRGMHLTISAPRSRDSRPDLAGFSTPSLN